MGKQVSVARSEFGDTQAIDSQALQRDFHSLTTSSPSREPLSIQILTGCRLQSSTSARLRRPLFEFILPPRSKLRSTANPARPDSRAAKTGTRSI